VTGSRQLTALFSLLLAGTSCEGPAGGPTCAPFDPAKYQASGTPSFRADIQPLLAVSCALSTACHGVDRGAGPQHKPFLGPKVGVAPDAPMLSAIRSDLLGPAERAPRLARVHPGRPGESFLLHKLEGRQSCPGVECPQGCGTRMPMVGDPLSPAEITTIRDWILQGAQDN